MSIDAAVAHFKYFTAFKQQTDHRNKMTVGANSVVYMLEMRKQLEGKEMTDVEVVCEDGSVTCHAVMLAAASRWWTQVQQLVDTGTIANGGHSYDSWWTQIQQPVDTGTAAGGHRYSSWWTQVKQPVDTGTAAGGHSYGSWWTQVQQQEDRGIAPGGHSYGSWWTQVQQLVDTVMAVIAAGGHSKVADGHRYSSWWTQVQQAGAQFGSL